LTPGAVVLTALLIVIAALLDIRLVRWLRRRRGAVPSRDASQAREIPLPVEGPPRQLRPLLTPSSDSAEGPPRRPFPATGGLVPSFRRHMQFGFFRDIPRWIRLSIALAGLLTSGAIGLRYARDVMVEGWQLWAWVVALAATTIALMPLRWPSPPRRLPWVWLGGLLVAALLLRVSFLETIPGWLHPDEAGLALYTQLHVYPRPALTVSPFVTGSAVQPTLHSYIVFFALRLAGESITSIRLPSALAGTLAVLATYAVIATIDRRRTALIAAAVMTTYHYHIHWSRLALNNVWDSLWVPLVLAAFAWGWKRKWSGGAVLAGLGLGLSQYFYSGSKVVVFLLALLVIQLWRESRDARRMAVHLSKLAATAVCAAAPLGFFALFNPGIYLARLPLVMGWTPEAVRQVTGSVDGWWEYFWHQVSHAFGAYLFHSDVTGFYGPGIAFTFGVSAAAFALGALWAIRTRRWMPLAWVLITAFLGGFVMLGAPSSSHYVVSIPGIVWLIALPIDGLIERGWWKLALAWLAAIMISDLVFYFGILIPRGVPHLSVPFPTVSTPEPPG